MESYLLFDAIISSRFISIDIVFNAKEIVTHRLQGQLMQKRSNGIKSAI